MDRVRGERSVPHRSAAGPVCIGSVGSFIVLMLPAVVTLLLTLIFGRFFCGLVCPMGTLLDGCHTIVPDKGQGEERKYRTLKFYLLGFLLVGAWGSAPNPPPRQVRRKGCCISFLQQQRSGLRLKEKSIVDIESGI